MLLVLKAATWTGKANIPRTTTWRSHFLSRFGERFHLNGAQAKLRHLRCCSEYSNGGPGQEPSGAYPRIAVEPNAWNSGSSEQRLRGQPNFCSGSSLKCQFFLALNKRQNRVDLPCGRAFHLLGGRCTSLEVPQPAGCSRDFR